VLCVLYFGCEDSFFSKVALRKKLMHFCPPVQRKLTTKKKTKERKKEERKCYELSKAKIVKSLVYETVARLQRRSGCY